MKNKKLILSVIALVAVVAILAGVYFATRPSVSQGSKEITITVVHKDGSEKVFTYRTDEEYLDKVLLAEGLIPEGNIVDGMFTIVDGEAASWEADQAYWALYIGEEYATSGICDTPVADGASFKLVYEKSTF